MAGSTPSFAQVGGPLPLAARPLSRVGLRRRIGLLKWLVPAVLVLVVALYELGPSHWIDGVYGVEAHLLAEIVLYGTFGPLLAYALLELLDRWLAERETSEAQAEILARATAEARASQQLSDDALQQLFAASLLLDSLSATLPDSSPEAHASLALARRGLEQAIAELHAKTRRPAGH
jgi:signal transduction histidine kinase